VPLIAGRAVLDLINTISWRGDPSRSEDHLQAATDCLTWATRAGVLSPPEAEQLARHLDRNRPAAPALIAELRDLRAAVTDALVPPTTAPVEQLEPLIRAALGHSHLVPDADAADRNRYHWQASDVDEHTPARRLTLDLLDLLTSRHGRLGVCADNQCQWVYLDTSHAQNRQWCSSTDCGNRHRVQRHQQRRLARTAPKEERSG
jgi:predicted RNA-binding Zn ribbon-like protein